MNDERLLRQTLSRSPDIMSGRAPLLVQRGAPAASIAYNTGLDGTDADLVVFAHQDVYLPEGWIARLMSSAAELDRAAPDWAVLGVFGVDRHGIHIGRCWSGDQGREILGSGGVAGEVDSLDEMLLVLRRSSGLRFDPGLPHFHFYGTDIVQTAQAAGRSAHVIEAPVIHNAAPTGVLGDGFSAGYRYLQRKWRARLPITTTVTRLTRSGLPLLRTRMSHRWRYGTRKEEAPRISDVRQLAVELGYEPVAL